MILLNMSMSLDGYVTGPDVSQANPLGIGGEDLHEWMFPPSEEDAVRIQALKERLGACIIGKRMYDLGLPHWGDVPFAGVETFVVTHSPSKKVPATTASLPDFGSQRYTFVGSSGSATWPS